jgi:hypothetical protein
MKEGNEAMKCEEFQAIGLEHPGGLADEQDFALFAAAVEHARTCAQCASLQEAWQQARSELQLLREETSAAETPARVEMRLRQDLALRHRTLRVRSFAIFGAWALASAALLFAAVSWWNWRVAQNQPGNTAIGNIVRSNAAGNTSGANDSPENAGTLVADNDLEDFTLLPGNLPQETDDSAIVRVRMQRGALGALGLPVNEERVSDWIQVDLLVGPDGQPKAVRLEE